MRTLFVTLAAALTAAIVLSTNPAAGGSSSPVSVTLRDAYTIDAYGNFAAWADRIRSDSNAPGFPATYTNGQDCVNANDSFFLRTDTYGCAAYTRALTLDFSDAASLPPGVDCTAGTYWVDDSYNQAGELNICGSNTIPDVRVLAGTLFNKSTTAVSLYFSLAPDFSHTAFELDFTNSLPVTILSSSARAVTANASSTASLYKISGNGRKAILGQFHMPFGLTAQRIR